MFAADGREGRLHRHGDLVAVARPVVLVDEIDLQVSQLGALAQVVLPDQSVEIDGCRGAGVSLVVAHLGQLAHHLCELVEHLRRGLDGRAFGHIHDDLELRLVVEGQHFHHHQLRDHQQHRQHDRADDRPVEPVPAPAGLAAAEERAQEAFEGIAQPGALATGRVGLAAQQLAAQPRREDQRHGQRNEHSHAGVDGYGTHVWPHESADEGHRQQGRDDREGREDGGTAHFVHRTRDDPRQR
jgi:hypothetical protein